MIRILETGWRNWPDPAPVFAALTRAWGQLRTVGNEQLCLVTGLCPTGADAFAAQWVEHMKGNGYPVHLEGHHALWKAHGKAAGPIRNTEMVNAGADQDVRGDR